MISQYGLKIKNIEAGTLFENNIGVRDHYEYKNAMFVNSLFKDFLIENGLEVWKDESTRDIICLEFNYGSRSYEQELEHLCKIARNAHKEYLTAKLKGDSYLIKKAEGKQNKITELLLSAREHRDWYCRLTKKELRKKIYNEGINVTYITKKKNGEIKSSETIHYKMLYRSTGKAKKGSCMFICDRLYDIAKDFLYMGIQLPKENPKIVEISASAPLIASSIVGKIQIRPENILILKDVDRYFETNVVSVETNGQKQCIAKYIEKYKLKNTLFDGQALIDTSIFPKWGNGYILLRHHFCKMAAFHTRMQDFFKDYFGEEYETATVKDMFGVSHSIKDIQIITTDNSMKWLKFDVSYETWCQKIYDNNCMFGIVKTAHESKLGQVQRMSYQMVNCLDQETMEGVVEKSVDVINKMKSDNNYFLDYLKRTANFSNDHDVLIALCKHNKDFVRSVYFRERKKKIVESYVLHFKSGEVINNAENLTIVGSPYAMLLYATTGNELSVDEDNTFYSERESIQCYTERFDFEEHLAFFRNPFNSKNNLTYLHNVYSDKLEKYFILGRQCIAVNMIGSDFQDRNNGSDQDSDFGYTTNCLEVVKHARKCYLNYPTIVNNIPKEKNIYSNTMDDYAKIDSSLADSQTDIGESSNLAQLSLTYAYNFEDKKYVDYVCILSVLAQVAIDNAKRKFDIDLSSEIKRIKKDMDIATNKYPVFWKIIKKNFNEKKINYFLQCPMNYLNTLKLLKFRNSSSTLPMSEFFIRHKTDKNKNKNKKIESLITKYSFELYGTQIAKDYEIPDQILIRSDFDDLVSDIRSTYISTNYTGLMSWLIDRAFMITPYVAVKSHKMKSLIYKNRAILLSVLYSVSRESFLECFIKK